MTKTNFLPLLGLLLTTAALFTAFSEKKGLRNPEVTFEEFLQQFPSRELPYVLDENTLKARLDKYVTQLNKRGTDKIPTPKRLEWQYFQFLPDLQAESSYSRLPMHAEPIAMFAAADNFAVMYSTSRSYRNGYASYYLSVFDKKGKQISSNMVAKVMPENITSVRISESLQAELKNWHIDWVKDYAKNGVNDNEIKGLAFLDNASIDLLKPTPKKGDPFELKPVAPEKEESLKAVEGIKTK